jgi:hypothetical protein
MAASPAPEATSESGAVNPNVGYYCGTERWPVKTLDGCGLSVQTHLLIALGRITGEKPSSAVISMYSRGVASDSRKASSFVDFLIRERRIQRHAHHLNPTTSRVGSFALSSLLSRSHEARKVGELPERNLCPQPTAQAWQSEVGSNSQFHFVNTQTGKVDWSM